VGSLRKNDAKLFGQEFADEAYNKIAISKALLYLISSTSHVYCIQEVLLFQIPNNKNGI